MNERVACLGINLKRVVSRSFNRLLVIKYILVSLGRQAEKTGIAAIIVVVSLASADQ